MVYIENYLEILIFHKRYNRIYNVFDPDPVIRLAANLIVFPGTLQELVNLTEYLLFCFDAFYASSLLYYPL